MADMNLTRHPLERDDVSVTDLYASALCWRSVVAGSLVMLVTTLVLMMFGAGIGLSLVSPWESTAHKVTTFAIATGVSLIVTQWLAAGLGGYLIGRLRRGWRGVHTHEIFFRDTAHGFIAWCLATLIGSVFIASSLNSAKPTMSGAALSAVAHSESASDDTYTDKILRPGPQALPSVDIAYARREIGRLLAVRAGEVNLLKVDNDYLTDRTASLTGISLAKATTRISGVVAEIIQDNKRKQVAEAMASKATARLSFFLFFSMLIGAFIASVAAALGGSHRDADPIALYRLKN